MEELTEELSTAQMAERVGVTQRTVQRWIKSGERKVHVSELFEDDTESR